jgi:hypothetical protein
MSNFEIDEKLKNQILRGEELLWLCQDLQSEKDGIDRPKHLAIDKSKSLDQFAQDISRSVVNMASLIKLLPMAGKLATLGRKLEADKLIAVNYGEDYTEVALDYLMAENGLDEVNK